jgi:hypothetical protein
MPFQAKEERVGQGFRCPACGQALIVPGAQSATTPLPTSMAKSRPLWLQLTTAAVVTLLLMAGLVFLLLRSLASPQRGHNESAGAGAATATQACPVPPDAIDSRPATPATAESEPALSAPPDHWAPEPPRKQLTVQLTQLGPAQPRAGDTLSIHLTGSGPEDEPLTYQFRSNASGPWQTAPNGRVRLANLKPGLLTLEFRVRGSQDRLSPVVQHTWAVKPGPDAAVQMPHTFKEGDRFYQTVEINRQSTYRVLDLDVTQKAQYTFVSSFRVATLTADGGLVVQQKIEAVQLSNADPVLQVQLNAILQKMQGATFTLTLSPRMEVVKFEGEPEALKLLGGTNLASGQTFVVWSFLDQDGWKELAELSFFQPRQSSSSANKWSRQLSHSWGPLGSWSGTAEYTHTGQQLNLDRFTYVLDLAYQPPRKGAGDLPFEIGQADFRLRNTGGTILFDADKGRAAAAEERFQVRGRIPVAYLGVAAVVDMEEVQVFQLRILDQDPLRRLSPGIPGPQSGAWPPPRP